MGKATLRDLRYNFAAVENLLAAGEEVQITRRKRVIARRPHPREASRLPGAGPEDLRAQAAGGERRGTAVRGAEPALRAFCDTGFLVSLYTPDANSAADAAQCRRSAAGLAAALSGLIQAAQVAGEHVHVQRTLAKALGAIGPAAAPAIPVLGQLRKSPRVRWPAEAAVRRIKALR